jgi:hypothetical protein
MADDLIPLADAITSLRAELQSAELEGEGNDLRFKVGPVEIEFDVVITKGGDVGAKASFKVLGVGVEGSAGGKVGQERTQKIKLTLTPVTRNGGDYLVSAKPTGADDGVYREPGGGG